ncbi:hypothetical protein [Staphylococcus kloosii]|nr:hypothetical protein [Staphylococcus kloosii]
MKFEEIFINIITAIIFLLVIGFVGSLLGMGIYSIWQIIMGG